jgi:hypothetical protein
MLVTLIPIQAHVAFDMIVEFRLRFVPPEARLSIPSPCSRSSAEAKKEQLQSLVVSPSVPLIERLDLILKRLIKARSFLPLLDSLLDSLKRAE